MDKSVFYKLCGVFGQAMRTRIRQMPRTSPINEHWITFVELSSDMLVGWSETKEEGEEGQDFITRLTTLMEVGCVWSTFDEHLGALADCYHEDCNIRIAEANVALLLETFDETALSTERMEVLPMGVWIPVVRRRLDQFRVVLSQYASTFNPDAVLFVYESIHRDPLLRGFREDPATHHWFHRIHHGGPAVFPYLEAWRVHVSAGRE